MANTPTTCPLKSKVWTVLLVLAVLPFALRGADLIIGAVAKGLTALTDEPALQPVPRRAEGQHLRKR